ncbi:MAG: hypothetical protein AB7O73_11715 [Bacteroidia bacterium]
MKRFVFGFLIVFVIAPNFIQAQNAAACADSTDYIRFRKLWNEKVGIFKESSWELPEIDFSRQTSESFEFTHVLTRLGITFMATVTKESCLNKISLVVKKDDGLAMQDLIATLNLADILCHDVNSTERQLKIETIKKEALEKKKPSSGKVGKYKFFYESGMIVNVLTVQVSDN